MIEGTNRATSPLTLPSPYLLFLGDVVSPELAKTAFGLRDWSSANCVGEFGCEGVSVSTGLPWLTPAEARARGAKSIIIGIANEGGYVADNWIKPLTEAAEAGLNIVSGLHTRLDRIPALAELASRCGISLIDVRVPPQGIPVGTGRKRSGKRLLTVGTDCALGKKYTALALTNAFGARGIRVDFRATGQTGLMISGKGMPMDAVVSDFLSGAAEVLSPDAAADHWDIIEGQGSLLHPAYAAVSLGLLHGSQPDVFVVCHEPGRTEMVGTAGYAVPTVDEARELVALLGWRTNPAIRCAGFAFNTKRMSQDAADALMDGESKRLGLPVADPMRGGSRFEMLVDSCLA